MTCPGHDNRETSDGIRRRDFLVSAVAIGGTNALTACLEREEGSPEQGTSDPENDSDSEEASSEDEEHGRDWSKVAEQLEYRNLDRKESQHAWNDYLHYSDGVPVPPRHHVLVMADYVEDGPPSLEHRESMEEVLSGLERAFEWSNEGLFFTVGYSPYYFERFDADLPENVELPEPRALSEAEEIEPDRYDLSLHLASDYAQAVLGAEEVLFGEGTEVNGVAIRSDFSGILERKERRTGFIGEGLPADNQDVDGVPDSRPVLEEAPLYMGFNTQHGVPEDHPFHGETEAPFVHSQSSESGVTIEEGVFAGGTTQQVSLIRLNLEDWYGEMTVQDRVERMFTPKERVEHVGETGEDAEEENPFVEFREEPLKDAQRFGKVGHAEKVARARTEDNQARLLRRDFDTTDDRHAGVHFVSLQRSISDFVLTRSLMEGADLMAEHENLGEAENNGILEFIEVVSRGNFLVPPRELRSLPFPA